MSSSYLSSNPRPTHSQMKYEKYDASSEISSKISSKINSKKKAYFDLQKSLAEGFKNEENIRILLSKSNKQEDIEKLQGALKVVLNARGRAQVALEEFKYSSSIATVITKLWDVEIEENSNEVRSGKKKIQ